MVAWLGIHTYAKHLTGRTASSFGLHQNLPLRHVRFFALNICEMTATRTPHTHLAGLAHCALPSASKQASTAGVCVCVAGIGELLRNCGPHVRALLHVDPDGLLYQHTLPSTGLKTVIMFSTRTCQPARWRVCHSNVLCTIIFDRLRCL